MHSRNGMSPYVGNLRCRGTLEQGTVEKAGDTVISTLETYHFIEVADNGPRRTRVGAERESDAEMQRAAMMICDMFLKLKR